MFESGNLLYEDVIPGGAHWSMELHRGVLLRLIDETGGANVGMLFYNPRNLLERYNAPDTLKCQHTFKLGKGHCLYSDMGRIFCSIVDDSVGWHDTVCGNLSERAMRRKWTTRSYQEARNDWTLSGEHCFSVELAKYGLGARDMAANLNLFSRVETDESGNLHYAQTQSRAGDHVDLRFEMDTLVVFHTCPHPLNPSAEYPKKPVRYQLYQAAEVAADDLCMNSRPENQRGFENNRIYHLCGGGA
jgi:urea carboxylase-associated protein 2